MIADKLISFAFVASVTGASFILATLELGFAQQPPRNFVLHDAPKPIPAIQFEDNQKRQRSLDEFRGKIVLLNIWATWCVPCRREMPSLDRLQSALGGSDFEVVALSIDRAGIEIVQKFYTEVGLRNLAIYIDSSGTAVRALDTVGVPASVLLDREGRELGRLIGPAEWDAPEMVDFLKSVISHRKDAARQRTDPDLHAPLRMVMASTDRRP